MAPNKRAATNPPDDILVRQRETLRSVQRELIQERAEREREATEYAQSRGYSERATLALLAERRRNAQAFVKKQRALLLRIEQGDPEAIEEARAAFEAVKAMREGIKESDRREHGDFDGLLGGFSEESSGLLRNILSYLRGHLLDQYSDEDARALLAEYEPRPGYRNLPIIDNDIEIVVSIMNMIRSAARCEGTRLDKLILGEGGARDKKRQAGTHNPKRPKINVWIGKQLEGDPTAKSPELWCRAPDWITDNIGLDAFRKRVTAVRKLRRK